MMLASLLLAISTLMPRTCLMPPLRMPLGGALFLLSVVFFRVTVVGDAIVCPALPMIEKHTMLSLVGFQGGKIVNTPGTESGRSEHLGGLCE